MRIGISTCPNDTFAFAALLEGRVPAPEPLEWVLDDVQELNARLLRRELDVAKGSFHAALLLSEDYCVLPVGAALGHGVGPLLLARDEELAARAPRPGDRVLCPGAETTATLLYRLFVEGGPAPEHVVFSAIMPALASGDAEYGVVIHEGRFTYAAHGLWLALDLGTAWEEATGGVPLPLGGILARRELGASRLRGITGAIRDSLRMAHADPESSLPAMRAHAQEFSDAVLRQHVELYVNENTVELGADGRAALEELRARAGSAGISSRSLF